MFTFKSNLMKIEQEKTLYGGLSLEKKLENTSKQLYILTKKKKNIGKNKPSCTNGPIFQQTILY